MVHWATGAKPGGRGVGGAGDGVGRCGGANVVAGCCCGIAVANLVVLAAVEILVAELALVVPPERVVVPWVCDDGNVVEAVGSGVGGRKVPGAPVVGGEPVSVLTSSLGSGQTQILSLGGQVMEAGRCRSVKFITPPCLGQRCHVKPVGSESDNARTSN
jgi:hypothetical protein